MESRLRAPSQKAEYCSVNAPWTYFFSPAGPDRSVVSSNPATAAAVIRVADQRHHLRGQGRRLRQAGMDEPVGHGSAGDVGDQLPAPLHRDMLEDDQVNRQGPQPGPDRQRGIRHARRAGRDMRPPAGAPRTRAGRAAPAPPPRPGSPPADTTGQPPGQRHPPGHGRTSRRPRDGDPRSGPGPPTSWTPPGCPAASRASSSPPAPQPAAASAAASAPAGRPSSAASRSSRCSATPRAPPPPAAPAGQRPPPPARRSARLRRDQLRLLPDQRITRIRGSGGTSVTARNHPRNHAQPPRQHHARRWNVTRDHSPQHQAQGPECLPDSVATRAFTHLVQLSIVA